MSSLKIDYEKEVKTNSFFDSFINAIDPLGKSKNYSQNTNDYTQYTVVANDSCWSIATKYGLTIDQLKTLNPNINWSNLQIGEIVNVQGEQVKSNLNPIQTPSNPAAPSPIPPNPSPNADNRIPYTVVAGDTCWAIATKYGLTLDQLKALNRNIDYDFIQVGQIIYVQDDQTKSSLNPNSVPPDSADPIPSPDTNKSVPNTFIAGDISSGVAIKICSLV